MKAKDWIVAVTFFMFPFMLLAPGIIWRGQLLFFIVMGSIILAFQIRNLLVRTFILYASVWQLCIFMTAFVTAINPGNGLSIILSLTSGAMIYAFVASGNISKAAWFAVIRTVIIIQAVLGTLQYFEIDLVIKIIGLFAPVRSELPGHIVGSIGNRNFLAILIAMSLPMFADWKWPVVKGINISVVLLFAILLLCMSPGTLAAIIGMTIYYCHKHHVKHWALCILGSILVSIAYAASYVLITGNHSNELLDIVPQFEQLREHGDILTNTAPGDLGRLAMWLLAGWKLAHDGFAFVFGFGPGAFWGRLYPVHSDYVSIFFQFGLIGFSMVASYLFLTLRRLFRSTDSVLFASFCILCIDMVANFPMEVASTGFMALIIAGLIERDRLASLPEKKGILELLYLHPDRTSER